MKVKQYNEMMAYLTRPGFNGGGSVKNKTVLPKRKPAAEVKKRKKINYEKIKQYLGKESQEFIERELGFAIGGSVETPKRGLVDEPGSYSQKSRYTDPDYKKKYYEKNKEKVLKQQRERYKKMSPEERKARIEKQIKRSQTEEGKKRRAEGFKRRKLAKNPLSAVDIKVLNRTKLILTYQKIINNIIKDHDGLRPKPEILSQLIDIHYDTDPELQKAWKK